MNPFHHPFAPALGVVAALIAPACAQLEEDAGSLNSKALALMNEAKWQDALQLLTDATDKFDKVAPQVYGAKFGVIWYRKGYCELQLKQWDAAMESFQTCYQRYPNQGDQVSSGGNNFHKLALLRGAEAAQGGENYAEAIRLYTKFLEERDATRDKFQPGALYVGMALSHFKTGNLAEGAKHFQTALRNRIRYGTPDAGIAAAFKGMVETAIEKSDEKLVTGFVAENRADLTLDPYAMEPFVKLYLKLGSDAIGAEMPSTAFAVFQLIPGTDVMIDDIKARIRMLGKRAGMQEPTRTVNKTALQASLDKLEKERSSGETNESILLAATGYLHDMQGNIRGAHTCYEQLERFYPKAKMREDNLFHLVRTSAGVGNYLEAEKHGAVFLDTYPDSRHVPDVRRILLTSLFFGGEYQTCIDVALKMIDQVEKGTKEHEMCHHVLGGSYYYTGQYDKAQPLLDEHLQLYPEGTFQQAAQYFQASNNVRLQFWAKAAALLDAFLEKHPDPEKNVYLPFALLDRALTHFTEDQMEPALDKLAELLKTFPNSEIADSAYILRGNILQAQDDAAGAETAFKKALEIAERVGHKATAGEALYYLVIVLTESGKDRIAEAVPYADKFWKDYAAGSPYQARLAVAQVDAYEAAGRGEEAVKRLEGVISGMASNPDADGLEEVINSYTEIYQRNHTPDELKDHFYDFPGVGRTDMAAKALLRTAIIGVFEQKLKAAQTDDERIKASAMIKVLFEELKNDFNLKDLTNYILVRTGDFLRERTSAPRQALPYYDAALERSDQSYRFAALFGRAAVLSGGSDAEKDQAVESLRRVYQDSQDKDEREKALYQIVLTQVAKQDHAATEAAALEYLNHDPKYTGFAPQAGLILARSYHERNMRDEALAAYARVWGAYPGLISISAPATKAWMELSYQRNNPATDKASSDRQAAYEVGWDYINKTRRFFENPGHKIPPEEVEMWKQVEALVDEYVASPDVKSMEELRAGARK